VPTLWLFDATAAAFILLHIAASASRRPNLDAIAATMMALEWSNGSGQPITRTDVQWMGNDL